MKVKLHTCGKKYFSESEWDQIHDAFEFFIDRHHMRRYTLPVYVTFLENISYVVENEKTFGLCVTKYARYGIAIKPSHFIVKLSVNNPMHKIFEVIFHEMTHVLQEMRGDFQNPNNGGLFYQNTYYSNDSVVKASYEEYRKFPWEEEAWSQSKQLLAEWYKTGKAKLSFWQKLASIYRTAFKLAVGRKT